MAAYAALISLSHILHQILHPPPLNKIIIDREQIEFLQGKVSFMIDFLETYSSRHSRDITDLETKIADAAYEAEDIIESNVVDQIHATNRAESSEVRCQSFLLKGLTEFLSMVCRKHGMMHTVDAPAEDISTLSLLCEGVDSVIDKFLSIEKTLIKIKVKEDLQPKISSTATSSRQPLPGGNITMVGFKEHMTQIMEALATDESSRQIIPIVGMGGIGKTTLATALYNNPLIVERFHILLWVTVSQVYTVRDLLLRLLSEIRKEDQNMQGFSDDEIGELVYKELFYRMYLLVMDDMWDVQAWDKAKRFLPDNNNGSRILVTTRLSRLADEFGSCSPYQIGFLDEEKSWDLLCGKVFGKEDCPVELEEIGKNIAKKCGGLPLALVVIGGLLAKSARTREHWESVAEDVTSAINYGNDEHLIMEILLLSYSCLPIYLKPCFLYLAVFPEDFEVHVSTLVRLWVAEGIIKPNQAKCLEEVALEHLEDLVSRNLIFVNSRGRRGKVKHCKIHDLIRDLCIRQVQKEKFVHIVQVENPNLLTNIETKRRLSVSYKKPQDLMVVEPLQSGRLINRSLLIHDYKVVAFDDWDLVDTVIGLSRLLKVVHADARVNISESSNIRYVDADSVYFMPSMSVYWNLQTIVLHEQNITLPAEIWQMPQLRHLKLFSITLPDPPPDDQHVIVLENLLTLQTITNFKWTEQVVERVPNLKKLKIDNLEGFGVDHLKNLVGLKKLESLTILCGDILCRDTAFPISLKSLILSDCQIPWEDMSFVGSLPNLEVLKLLPFAAKGQEWNPNEGEFCRLKSLSISMCDLKIWGAENYHFPCLEYLLLECVDLVEIPIGFAEISTFEVIELNGVEDSVRISVRQVSEEREELGYEPLQLRDYGGDRQSRLVYFQRLN